LGTWEGVFRLVINVRKMVNERWRAVVVMASIVGMSWKLGNKVCWMWSEDRDVGEWNGYWQRIGEQVYCKQWE
jgi:hypothetical protein